MNRSITVRTRTTSARFGVSSEYVYEARLVPDPAGSAGELKGTGTYRGFVMARPANCELAKKSGADRYEVRGTLEASGSISDWRALGGPANGMMYVLATTDWPLMPLYGAEGPYAKTAEDKEGVKGLGTTRSGVKPVSVAGAVTTETRITKLDASACGGIITVTEDIRVERK